ncbi:hypothetical protein AB1E22_21685 [Buttiauxella gaviniae]|uniref:Lipoprotein n=1 Tax=Buttiauxella gaviniae TaxID=82990 RepID=A0ABV3P0F2_9ENTR
MIKIIIPTVIVMAFFVACGNAPAKRIAQCERHGEKDGVCAAQEWDFDMDSPYSDSDLSNLAGRVKAQE